MRRRFLRHGSRLAMLALGLTVGAGCAGRTQLETDLTEHVESDAGPSDAGPPPITKSDQLDVLFVVDNSPNTSAFHDLLAASVSYLTQRLTSPACVNGLGNVVATTPNPTDPCPVGVREFSPVRDLHLAVISTSIGGHGADTCSPASQSFDPTQNDGARLLTRDPGGGTVPTYLDQGFLAWDPLQKLSPPGESDPAELTAKLMNMIQGTGSKGCGFESQLESIYRFLVDPDPYLNIQIVDGKATLVGTDSVLLQQREDFLRPGSAVAVVLITDENDCSTRDGSQYFFAEQGGDPNNPNTPFHLPRARSVCAVDPNDPCCASCGQSTPEGCLPTSADAACLGPPPDNKSDPINLRCFDQKRRFGVDFLQPIDRYVRGLSDPTIPTRDGSLVPNPLFAQNRSPELVTLTGIVGVPWQDIAVEPKALATGLKTTAQIDWSMILGDPAKGTPPTDPLMIESIDPRSGQNPATGAMLAPSSAGPLANPINGHERDIPDRDDLQYACIYPMIAFSPCAGTTCPCLPPGDDPICQAPDGSYGAQAGFGRALPGIRELRLLKELGDRAAVASVCAVSGSGPTSPTFGYKPALDATLRMLRGKLE